MFKGESDQLKANEPFLNKTTHLKKKTSIFSGMF